MSIVHNCWVGYIDNNSMVCALHSVRIWVCIWRTLIGRTIPLSIVWLGSEPRSTLIRLLAPEMLLTSNMLVEWHKHTRTNRHGKPVMPDFARWRQRTRCDNKLRHSRRVQMIVPAFAAMYRVRMQLHHKQCMLLWNIINCVSYSPSKWGNKVRPTSHMVFIPFCS